MTPRDFHNIIRELVDENPLAVRAVLKILSVEFTESVPTLAVTCDDTPRLLVNLTFVSAHCRTDAEVKAVICHEFLHVLLRHTDRVAAVTPEEHLAADAVINAIIHRTLGIEASAMMSRYYANERGLHRLLRRPRQEERSPSRPSAAETRLLRVWESLYAGLLVVDDIRDLATGFKLRKGAPRPQLIGNHADVPAPGSRLTEADSLLQQALDNVLKAMNGSGIFRSPGDHGIGAAAYRAQVQGVDTKLWKWQRQAYEVLRRHLLPDPKSTAKEPAAVTFTLPVLSPGDRRASLRSLWSPFLPDALWNTEHTARVGTAHVYLDVSGSMDAEMPLIVNLLGKLSRYIRRPFWAFSNHVAPARIERGQLLADTTGGTSMKCVLEHIERTQPAAAIVVTDGYIEPLTRADVRRIGSTRLHVIVTRDGNSTLLQSAGLSYTQLSGVPQ